MGGNKAIEELALGGDGKIAVTGVAGGTHLRTVVIAVVLLYEFLHLIAHGSAVELCVFSHLLRIDTILQFFPALASTLLLIPFTVVLLQLLLLTHTHCPHS